MSTLVRWMLVDNSAMPGGGLFDYPRLVDSAREGLEHVGYPATTTAQALDRAATDHPDVVLLDLKMPKEPRGPKARSFGVECAEAIAALEHRPQIVIFSNDDPDPSDPSDRELMSRLNAAGVSGYLTHDVPTAEVAQAIVDASRGLSSFRQPEVLDAWRRCVVDPHTCFSERMRMTPAQHRVMVAAYSTGFRTRKLAEYLRLSPDAIDSYLAEAGKRTGAWPRNRLMVWASRNCSYCASDPNDADN